MKGKLEAMTEGTGTGIYNNTAPGAVALVGSGEYLDVMNEVDRHLLETVGGASEARVALMPTASGLEPGRPAYWNGLGKHHFEKLGVRDIRATRILERADADDPEQLALLQGANFYYFSGGNPQHTIATFQSTAAWNVIKTAYEHGAVLAGCSAGAMMMGGLTLSLRQAMTGSIALVEALAIVPGLIVFPHFDRMTRQIDRSRIQQVFRLVPQEYVAVGIDEDTALVRDTVGDSAERWRVMGRQTVTVFRHDAEPHVFRSGAEVIL